MMSDLWMLWSVPLVGYLGYVSHRASLCTVRAVADVLEGRRFDMLGGFARAVLWAMLLTVPASYFFPDRFPIPAASGPLWAGLLGGLLFGLGAALNRGCSFSTLQRLADRDWRMLASLGGFIGGSALAYLLPLMKAEPEMSELALHATSWLAPLMVALVVWAVLESSRLWRRAKLKRLQHNQRFSPAATAVILGLGGGILYLGFGPWTYSNSLQASAGALVGERLLPSVFQLALLPALLSGMFLSAWRRGSWRNRKPHQGWGRNLIGGTFMGLGGALIPGGNDTLLLRLIPSMTPHSLWSYLMLIVGVACGLMFARRFGLMPCETVGCESNTTPESL